MIVVDTNIISYFWIPGQFTDQAKELFETDANWISVPLWRIEMQNVLAKYLRKKLITEDRAVELIYLAENQLDGHEFSVTSKEVLDLIFRSNCTSYDCQFVALAIKNNVSLITTDQPLVNSFPRVAVHLKTYLEK